MFHLEWPHLRSMEGFLAIECIQMTGFSPVSYQPTCTSLLLKMAERQSVSPSLNLELRLFDTNSNKTVRKRNFTSKYPLNPVARLTCLQSLDVSAQNTPSSSRSLATIIQTCQSRKPNSALLCHTCSIDLYWFHNQLQDTIITKNVGGDMEDCIKDTSVQYCNDRTFTVSFECPHASQVQDDDSHVPDANSWEYIQCSDQICSYVGIYKYIYSYTWLIKKGNLETEPAFSVSMNAEKWWYSYNLCFKGFKCWHNWIWSSIRKERRRYHIMPAAGKWLMRC